MTISIALWVIATLVVSVLYFHEGRNTELKNRTDEEFDRFFGKQQHDAHVQAYLHYRGQQSSQAARYAPLRTVTI